MINIDTNCGEGNRYVLRRNTGKLPKVTEGKQRQSNVQSNIHIMDNYVSFLSTSTSSMEEDMTDTYTITNILKKTDTKQWFTVLPNIRKMKKCWYQPSIRKWLLHGYRCWCKILWTLKTHMGSKKQQPNVQESPSKAVVYKDSTCLSGCCWTINIITVGMLFCGISPCLILTLMEHAILPDPYQQANVEWFGTPPPVSDS